MAVRESELVVDEQARTELTTDLDALCREGARRILAVALEAEVEAYIAAHAELTDEHGHRLVGQAEVARPRVDDRRTDPARASGGGSTARCCPAGAGAAPRWPRCYCC